MAMLATKAARRIYNPLIDDYVTFIETSAESGGKRTVGEIDLAPGGGNPLHYHRKFSETFEAIEGRVGLELSNKTIYLEAGDAPVTAEIGVYHRFFNDATERCRFRVTLEPGSTNFEKTLMVAYGLARDGLVNSNQTPKNLSHLALLVVWSDTVFKHLRFLTPFEPFFRFVANRAVRRGIEGELMRKYNVL